MKEKAFWLLCAFADRLTTTAFNYESRLLRWIFIIAANSADRIAFLMMTEEMKNKPAKSAPSNAQHEGPPALSAVHLDAPVEHDMSGDLGLIGFDADLGKTIQVDETPNAK